MKTSSDKVFINIVRYRLEFAIAIMLIAISMVFFFTDPKLIIPNIGITLLTSSILYIVFDLTKIFFDSHITETIWKTGLLNSYLYQSELVHISEQYTKMINNASTSIVFVGVTLNTILQETITRTALLKFLSDKHNSVRFLLMSESSQYLMQRGIELENVEELFDKTKSSYKFIRQLFKEYNDRKLTGSFEVHVYDRMPVHSMIIIDTSKMYYMPYKYGIKDGPWFEFINNNSSPSSFFRQYYESYNSLWNSSDPFKI